MTHSSNSLLGIQNTDVSVTGTLDETVLATFTIPGHLIGPNGILKINYLYTVPLNTNVKYIRVRLGGTSFIYAQFTNTQTVSGQALIYNRGVENSQISYPTYNQFGVAAGAPSLGSIDTSINQNVTITAQLTNITDTVTLKACTVEIIK